MAGGMTQGPTVRKPVYWPGALACVVFAVIAVALRGVRWDETWEHAQILTGQVVYPAGHPLALYVHNAFSFQTYLSAWLLVLGGGPLLVCGLRNVLFLLTSMLPVYGMTAWMARSAVAGLMAALLMMQGILLEFDGSYPTMVWPEIYSNGHIGGGVVLLALAALVAGRFRTAFFLVGLIPCIHVGQWPPLVATAGFYGVYLLYSIRRSTGTALPQAVRWSAFFALGFGVTLLFWFVHRHYTLPLPTSGPFAAGGDTAAVWKGYTALHDPHRRFPPGNGHVLLAGTLVLAALGACWGRGMRLRRACIALGLYTSATGLLVWGTMVLHGCLGPDIPFLFIAWMPYRLINHLPVIVLALMVSLILSRWPDRGWWVVMGALFFGMLHPVWALILGPSLYGAYVAGGESVAFGLYGLALVAVVPSSGPGRARAIVQAAMPILPLAMYHRFGAVCVVTGIAGGWLLDRVYIGWSLWSARWKVPAAVTVLAGSIALLAHQYDYRKELPVSAFQQAVADRLAGSGDVLLLAPPDNLLLQATTGLPVLAEVATPSLISYVPEIGPSIDRLYTEVYGSTFRIPAVGAPEPPSWESLWRQRSVETWTELSQRYGFTHVIAPADLSPQLREIVAADGYALYAVDP